MKVQIINLVMLVPVVAKSIMPVKQVVINLVMLPVLSLEVAEL